MNGREGILVLHGVESHIVPSTVICCGRVSSIWAMVVKYYNTLSTSKYSGTERPGGIWMALAL